MTSGRIRVAKKLLFLVLFSVCQIAGVAKAQINNLQGTFRLQNEVLWGKAVLPAGDYSFTIDQEKDSMVFAVARSADGKRTAFAEVTASGKPESGGSYIFIANDGTRRVRLLNLPETNLSLAFGPMSKRDREELNAAKTEVVPVVVAKK
jgi:hypothetical protein